VSLTINRRLVDPTDPENIMNNVAIMSVNGVAAGAVTIDYDVPGKIHVPASTVFSTPPVEPLNQNFHASTLLPITPGRSTRPSPAHGRRLRRCLRRHARSSTST
jgi:hypothetical protein